jgi:NDP-sugar pyrophosphorylase family protein
MKALILIGGFGTRLRPLTCSTPKPLLPIANKPFLEYQLELLKKHGIYDVVLCVAYLSHEFENYFGTGKKWGMKIQYVHEKEPLGTGGAIRNAAHLLREPAFIFNGDILTDMDLTAQLKYHRKNKALITIGLSRVKDPTIYGLIETAKGGRIQRFIEKPSWDEVTCNTINAGMYIFEPEVLDFIPEGINFSVERGLFPSLLAKGYALYGFDSNAYWLDIGTVEKYLQAHGDLLEGRIKLPLPGTKKRAQVHAGKHFSCGESCDVSGTVVCGNNVTIGPFCQMHGAVCIGNNVTIGKGSYIADTVILDDTTIGEGTRIEKSVVGRQCTLEANVSLSAGSALGNTTMLRKYSRV